MTSAYWNQTGPDGYEYKVRECKNDGCAEVVYYDENSGRFAELQSGEVHDCPYYKRNNTSQKSSGQRPPQQQRSPELTQQQDQSSHIQQIEEYYLIQVEELKRHTDLLVTQKENMDLISQYMRAIATIVKNIDEHLDSKLKESVPGYKEASQ